MGFDPFAAAAQADVRSRGMGGGGFKPGYPLVRVARIDTRDQKERIRYNVRYGRDGKRFIDGTSIWGIGVFGFSKKSEEEQTEMFRDNIVSKFKALVVKTGKGKTAADYTTLFDYCRENELAGGTSTWNDWADAVCAVANELAAKEQLYLRIVNRERNPAITEDHIKVAKDMLEKWEMSPYYNGPTGFVLHSQWKEVEGKTPGPKSLPTGDKGTWEKVEAALKEAKAGVSGGSAAENTGSSDAPPPEDDDDIPF